MDKSKTKSLLDDQDILLLSNLLRREFLELDDFMQRRKKGAGQVSKEIIRYNNSLLTTYRKLTFMTNLPIGFINDLVQVQKWRYEEI